MVPGGGDPKPSQKASVGFCLEMKWGKEPKPVPFPQLDETRMSEANLQAPVPLKESHHSKSSSGRPEIPQLPLIRQAFLLFQAEATLRQEALSLRGWRERGP